MLPGLRLRQSRERLGLTCRDVERASFELAARRGRPELILHTSRLADIENRGVVPGLHKLYTLAVVYHLVRRSYRGFPDGGAFHAPLTHLAAPPVSLKTPLRFDPAFDPKRTELLSRMIEKWGSLEGVLTNGNARHRYGYIGLSDRRMAPLLRPGSVVFVDVTVFRTTIGPMNTTVPCILSSCGTVIAVGGFTRTVRACSCNPILYPAVCPRFGGYRKKPKWSAVWSASLLG
jgi:hypothetical protein